MEGAVYLLGLVRSSVSTLPVPLMGPIKPENHDLMHWITPPHISLRVPPHSSGERPKDCLLPGASAHGRHRQVVVGRKKVGEGLAGGPRRC